METVYKLRYKPTGLFYQPIKDQKSGLRTNLSKRGKIFETRQFVRNLKRTTLIVSDRITEKFSLNVRHTPTGNVLDIKDGDLEVVEYSLMEKGTPIINL